MQIKKGPRRPDVATHRDTSRITQRGSANMLKNVQKITCMITTLTFTINKLVNIFVVSSLNLILRKYRHNDAFILLCSDQRIFTKHDENRENHENP